MKAGLIESGPVKTIQKAGINRWFASFERNTTPKHLRLQIFYGPEEALPKFASTNHCSAIFDGVLYNQQALQKELGGSAEWNEARIAIESYLRWGEEALYKIRGLFALILWDETEEKFLCARDPLGIHSFFYSDAGSLILLSSCIESLLSAPQISKRVNRAALADQLCHRFPFPEETFFLDVKRIMAGHALREVRKNRTMYRYWNPVPLDRPIEWLGIDGALQFDALFEQAISRCLSLGPSGIFLSGGLDSVSVAGISADVAKKKEHNTPWALSLAFPHPECREEAIQKGVATGLGLPQLMVPFEDSIGQQGLLQAAVETSMTLPSPTLNPWKPSYIYLAGLALQKGCKVILNGAGGDEWLTVNPKYAADLIRRFNFLGLIRLTGNFLRSYRLPRLSLTRYVLWNSGMQPLLAMYGAKFLKRFAPLNLRRRKERFLRQSVREWVAPDPELRSELEKRMQHTVEKLMNTPDPAGDHGFYFSSLPNSFVNPLKSIEFEEEFAVGTRLGIRIIPPYYDPDLLDVLLRLPPELLHEGGREKAIVRQTLARRFPHLKFEKQKKASALNYFQSILLTEGPVLWEKIGGPRTLQNLGIVKPESMNRILGESLKGGTHYDTHRIWELLTLEMWSRQHTS